MLLALKFIALSTADNIDIGKAMICNFAQQSKFLLHWRWCQDEGYGILPTAHLMRGQIMRGYVTLVAQLTQRWPQNVQSNLSKNNVLITENPTWNEFLEWQNIAIIAVMIHRETCRIASLLHGLNTHMWPVPNELSQETAWTTSVSTQ